MIEVRFSTSCWSTLRAALLARRDVETKAFLLCRPLERGDDLALLVREVVPVPESAEGYADRSSYRVQTQASFVHALLQRCATEDLALVEAHTHPWGPGATFSSVDHRSDPRKFRATQGMSFPFRHASLVFGSDMGFDGHAWDPASQRCIPIDRIKVVGGGLDVQPRYGTAQQSLSTHQQQVQDRQIRAFGTEGQARLSRLTVGVVGTGGLGSMVVQALGLLGVGHFVLVDPDRLEASNANRVVGVTADDVEQHRWKVEAVADGLRRACVVPPQVTALPVPLEHAAHALAWCDVLVGAVDRHSVRQVLNQLAVSCLLPYFDGGVGIEAAHGRFVRGGGQVRTVLPGSTACLACYNEGVAERVAEQWTPHQRAIAEARGYVRGADVKAPQVVFLNGVLGHSLVWEVVKTVTGVLPGAPYVYYDLASEEAGGAHLSPVSTGRRDECFVCAEAGLLASGLAEAQRGPSTGAAALPAPPQRCSPLS